MNLAVNRGHSAFSALRKKQSVPNQSGIALVAVLVFLLVIAATVALKGGEELGEVHVAAADAEARRIDYVAQAGMQHALWQARNAACTGDFTIPATSIGPDEYNASTTGGGSNTVYALTADQDAWIRSDNPTNNGSGDQHIRSETGKFERALFRFDLSTLPANAQVRSATAWFFVETGKEHPEGPLTVERVTADWDEGNATWDTIGAEFDAAPLGMIAPQPAGGWVSVNLTAQVQSWVNGQPNFGVVLGSTEDGIHTEYKSRDDGATPPRLEVVVGAGTASPLNVTAIGTLDSGKTHTLSRPVTQAYQPPSSISLQLGVDAGEDAKLDSFYSARNYGGQTYLQVNDNGSDWQEYPVIRFDLSRVPKGALIRSAGLELRHKTLVAPGTATIHQLTRDWVEGTQSGTGQPDGATWFTYDGTATWNSPGGDINPDVVAEAAITGGDTWVTWEVTPLVQRWLAGAPNFGLMLRPANGVREAEFYSKEAADPAYRPKLIVTYACECGSACMAPQGSGTVLMVVINPTTVVPRDVYKKALFESWGYTVTIVGESSNQATYDTAIAAADVVFISETVNANQVGTRLQDAPIGVVSQDGKYNSALGIAASDAHTVGSAINVADTDHYITLPFAAGPLEIYSAAMEQLTISGAAAPDLRILADAGGAGALVALDTGAIGTGGGPLPARRVLLPLGRDGNTNWDYLNGNGVLLVQRALAWGMGADDSGLPNVLLVVADPASLTSQEDAKKTLIESWDFIVNLIDDNESQANFNAALAINDVAFVTEGSDPGAIGSKLTGATVGVVNEEKALLVELGFTGDTDSNSRSEIVVLDNTHYITSGLALGTTTITASNQPLSFTNSGSAPGAQILAETNQVGSFFEPSLLALEANAELFGGGFAAGRRVALPWGDSGFDINALNADGLMIMRRALEWGAGIGSLAAATKLLFVVSDDSSPTAAESAKQAQIESWGYAVSLIADEASQAQIDTAVADNDVVYISGDVSDSSLGTKLTPSTLGMVNEQIALHDELGFSSGAGSNAFTNIMVVDNTHPITDGYSAGWLTVLSASHDLYAFNGTLAPGLQTLAEVWVSGANYWEGLAVLDAGADLYGGGTAAGRRAQLPWGVTGFDFSALNADGLEIMRRAIEWAGEAGDTEPIAHWKLDDGTGTTAIDSVGGNDGTLSGVPDWVAGTLGDALDFDGSSDRVTTNSNFTPPPAGTVSFWMQVDGSPGTHGRILGLHDTWEIRHVTNGTPDGIPYGLVFDLGVSGVNTEFVTTTTIDTPGQWYHVAASYDTATDAYAVYIDGVPHKSGTYPSSLSVPAANNLSLGTRTGSLNYYDGKLDDVRIYDTVLPPAEIADLAAEGGGGGGFGGVTFEEFTDASLNNNSSTLDVPKPGSTAAGDLLIASVATDGNEGSSLSPPAGWTTVNVGENANGRVTLGVWWKIATGSEPAQYTFSWSSSEKAYGSISRFTGHDPSSPILFDAGALTGSGSSTPICQSLTTLEDNTLVLRTGGFDDADITAGDPGLSGHTAINMGAAGGASGKVSGGSGYFIQSPAGDSGLANFTLTNSEEFRTVTLGIRPAP